MYVIQVPACVGLNTQKQLEVQCCLYYGIFNRLNQQIPYFSLCVSYVYSNEYIEHTLDTLNQSNEASTIHIFVDRI